MIKHLVVLILLISFNCYALSHEEFSTGDIIRQSAYTLITIADWRLTKNFRKEGLKELNPILGDYPSQSKVDTLVFGAIVSHYLISYFLSGNYREAWQYFFIMTEIKAVSYNLNNTGAIEVYRSKGAIINFAISF